MLESRLKMAEQGKAAVSKYCCGQCSSAGACTCDQLGLTQLPWAQEGEGRLLGESKYECSSQGPWNRLALS